MSLPKDLLDQARLLATKEPRKPKQASLRRSVSTSYYALFHLLVADAVQRVVPGGRVGLRNSLSRAFNHSTMRKAARQFAAGTLSPAIAAGLEGRPVQQELVIVASTLVDLQEQRHAADYDPARAFTRPDVIDITVAAERAFANWYVVRKSVQADTFLVSLLALDQMRG